MTCAWTYIEDDDLYLASCNTEWHFEDGTPSEYGVKFCPGCGKAVEIAQPPHIINGSIIFENPKLPDPRP